MTHEPISQKPRPQVTELLAWLIVEEQQRHFENTIQLKYISEGICYEQFNVTDMVYTFERFIKVLLVWPKICTDFVVSDRDFS